MGNCVSSTTKDADSLKDIADLAVFFFETFQDSKVITRAQKGGFTSLHQLRNLSHEEKERFYQVTALTLQDRKKFDEALEVWADGNGGIPTETLAGLRPERSPTMAQVAEKRKAINDSNRAMSPEDALKDLKDGNYRFWTGTSTAETLAAMDRRQLILGQAPKVAIIGCSDSRVPVEMIFDQGPGDIFTIRVAGNNYMGNQVAGSLDYAINHLQVHVVLVLGHEGCGAVKAAQLPDKAIDNEPESLRVMLQDMKGGLKSSLQVIDSIVDTRARDREAVCVHAQDQAARIMENPATAKLVQDGKLLVLAGFYEISSGCVDFFQPVSKPTAPALATVG